MKINVNKLELDEYGEIRLPKKKQKKKLRKHKEPKKDPNS
jgi:hypothetical protein